MSSSYDVLAAIDMERVAGHPVGGGVAQRGDAARAGVSVTPARIALAVQALTGSLRGALGKFARPGLLPLDDAQRARLGPKQRTTEL